MVTMDIGTLTNIRLNLVFNPPLFCIIDMCGWIRDLPVK